MKTQINSPGKSKINYSAAAMVLAGALFATGVIPEEQVETVAAAMLTIGGVAVGIFRTFFTKPEDMDARQQAALKEIARLGQEYDAKKETPE